MLWVNAYGKPCRIGACPLKTSQTDPNHPTGTVKVTIDKDEPGYEILADQAYDFIDAQQLNLTNSYSVIYHGTLALRNRVSEQALNDLKARHTGKVFVDVNLRAALVGQRAG